MKQLYAIPNSLAATTAIVFVVCRVLIGLFPETSFSIAESWFHGIKLSEAGAWNLTPESFILGVTSSTLTAWLIGFIFIKIYRLLTK